MITAFFESIKYVGHLFPVALLRVFMGFYYFDLAYEKFIGDYLNRPRLADQIAEVLPQLQVSQWYRDFLETSVIPQWQYFSFVVVGIEFAIAISYLFGYVVRPTALLAALFSINMMMLSGPQSSDFFKLLVVVHLTMAWVGAGRCLGFDYYFFKRRRGIWW